MKIIETLLQIALKLTEMLVRLSFQLFVGLVKLLASSIGALFAARGQRKRERAVRPPPNRRKDRRTRQRPRRRKPWHEPFR